MPENTCELLHKTSEERMKTKEIGNKVIQKEKPWAQVNVKVKIQPCIINPVFCKGCLFYKPYRLGRYRILSEECHASENQQNEISHKEITTSRKQCPSEKNKTNECKDFKKKRFWHIDFC